MRYSLLTLLLVVAAVAVLFALQVDALWWTQFVLVLAAAIATQGIIQKRNVLGWLILLTYALLGIALVGLAQFALSRLMIGPVG